MVAFQEVEWSITERVDGMPSVTPLVQQAATWMIEGFRQAKAEMQIGFKFPGIFLDAGLPLPQISLDGIAGTEADWVGYDFLTDALRDILPKLREYGILLEDLDAATYVKLMREEIIQRHSLFPMFFMAGAWTRKA